MFGPFPIVRSLSIAGSFVLPIILISLILAGTAFGSPQADSMTYSLPVKAGWNLLALPVEIAGGTKETIFPTAVSNAFFYDSGYAVADTLVWGRGFWIKFASAETIQVRGAIAYRDTFELHPGWNIVGGPTNPAAVSAILANPTGVTISNYYGFLPDEGYTSAELLLPGMGYWVKVSQSVTLDIKTMYVRCPGTPAVDYGGRVYNTVQIGNQCWLRENLDVGTMIGGWPSNNGMIEKSCYNDDPANCILYGGLYDWREAMQYGAAPGARGICPPGWHLPTLTEFDTLRATVNNDGDALKAIGQGTGWGEGTNASGFSALPSGMRDSGYDEYGTIYYNLGDITYLWSSTAFSASDGNCLYLGAISIGYYHYPGAGYSVRCLED
jgi:uncharacterized protein (TIGR02145 family)